MLISLEYNTNRWGGVVSYVTVMALIAKDSDVRLARLLVELDQFKLLDSTYVVGVDTIAARP